MSQVASQQALTLEQKVDLILAAQARIIAGLEAIAEEQEEQATTLESIDSRITDISLGGDGFGVEDFN